MVTQPTKSTGTSGDIFRLKAGWYVFTYRYSQSYNYSERLALVIAATSCRCFL
jgi:hypothetical protein